MPGFSGICLPLMSNTDRGLGLLDLTTGRAYSADSLGTRLGAARRLSAGMGLLESKDPTQLMTFSFACLSLLGSLFRPIHTSLGIHLIRSYRVAGLDLHAIHL